jgi:hypothetical protein
VFWPAAYLMTLQDQVGLARSLEHSGVSGEHNGNGSLAPLEPIAPGVRDDRQTADSDANGMPGGVAQQA